MSGKIFGVIGFDTPKTHKDKTHIGLEGTERHFFASFQLLNIFFTISSLDHVAT